MEPVAVHGSLTEVDDSSSAEILDIIHFNDVYNIEPRERYPEGGAAHFNGLVKALQKSDTVCAAFAPEKEETDYSAHHRQANDVDFLELSCKNRALTLFSGDAFSPSIMSTVTRGKQMPPILNETGIHAAVPGNHDFDFGLDVFKALKRSTNFPWVLSNCDLKATGQPLGKCFHYVCINMPNGKKVGIIGLIEYEWLLTLASIDENEVNYKDFVETANSYAQLLREKHGCDIIVALTHMRKNNDLRLCNNAKNVDLVLGGHDHSYCVYEEGLSSPLVKSGTDFRQLSYINYRCDLKKLRVLHHLISKSIPSCPKTAKLVNEFGAQFGERLCEAIGYTEVDLDARFKEVRATETNVGNFAADLMKDALEADAALLNSGTIRADDIIPRGEFTLRHLVSLFPVSESLVKLEVTGEQLLNALENGVSKYPQLEGRFPQVSGIFFEFDPDKEPYKRVDQSSVRIGDEKRRLDLTSTYTLAVKSYLATGKDGYDMLNSSNILMDEEEGIMLDTLVRNHFRVLAVLNGIESSKDCCVRKAAKKWKSCLRHKCPDKYGISPIVEGRIRRKESSH